MLLGCVSALTPASTGWQRTFNQLQSSLSGRLLIYPSLFLLNYFTLSYRIVLHHKSLSKGFGMPQKNEGQTGML